jgi:hypothetical protein
MTRQWKRNVEVLVGKQEDGLLIKNLRIMFDITKTVDEIPNSAIIKIYNLNPINENKIKDEYKDIVVRAGYADQERLIFTGSIKYVYRYREGNDYVTEIEGGDGDDDYKNATINETLAAGTTDEQLIDKAVDTFKTTTKGTVKLKGKARRRGKVVTGNTRTVLKNVAARNGANWSIQDGELVIVPVDDILPDEAIVINSQTGMLSAPETNDRGIAVKCLMNPQLKINGAIQLDNNSIKAKRNRPQSLATPREKQETVQQNPVRQDPDGIYKVIKLTHKGDNRGNEWYSELECVGINEPIPKSRGAQ